MKTILTSCLPALLLSCLSTPLWAAPVTPERLLAADQEPGNWMAHGRNYGEERFSPLKQINDDNVDELGLAWSYKYDLDRVVEATPVVVDGVMYTTGAYSMVFALDAKTGEELWRYDPKVWRGIQGRGCCDAANRGVAVWKDKVYVGVYDGRLEALDANTGKLVWSANTIIDKDRNYTISGAPRIAKGKVIIGNGGAEFGVRGYITAYDADTGKQAWRFFTVPGDPAKGDETETITQIRKTWYGDQYWKQGGGGTVWDSMAYDADLDLLYIGVGNGSLWNYKLRSEAKGDNLFLSSIVAIKPDTGEYVWHYQTTPGDAWDYTATQHIIVTTLEIDGKPRRVVMQAPKNGFFYVLDAATGEFISAEKFGVATWAKSIDPETGRPVIDHEVADYWTKDGPSIIFPGSQGAHNWPPMSYNPQTGLVYIPQQVTMEEYNPLKEAVPPQAGVPNLGLVIPSVPETLKGIEELATVYRGSLIAWDPIKQEARWKVPYQHIHNSGTLSTAGNLVFQGLAEGRVAAYAADTGDKLWQQEVSSGVVAGPITYSVDGEQYVAFNVGWGGAFPITFGALAYRTGVVPDSRLYVFKLNGKAPMPPVKRRELTLPTPPPVTADAATLAEGKQLYQEHCGVCHGLAALSANIIPDLRYLTPEVHEQFLPIVYGMRANKGMPPFAGILELPQVEKIHQYIIQRSHDWRDELIKEGVVADPDAKASK
ncbi:PQQ-dependent dehydrogenase, methanol/ethanol family [Aestuariicella hydrocarbonica]|uniref:PQQ-dependent dehydrogenase, methanol/ethanol family n=1 Tax=Pseudomaricurvus hydrocarbonicus TaxID=1470433 RepID=A0A9E5MM08_9GAMM|nr:PQQ-dependent dehydrogenase, methanol/ethanol family [Aestuariicella hydrocarbonica]NHO65165.1 PQQ-dependent dehydrogenase, methanol/ethanol family [Aestuariicella hydrocarbonica]